MERKYPTPLTQAKRYLLEQAKINGTLGTLKQIHERYGEIVASDSRDYHEMAMSFLNLFDRKTRRLISQSPWFCIMIESRVNIGILHEELKTLQGALDGRSEEEKKNAIKMMNSLVFGGAYRLMGFGEFDIPSSRAQHELHAKLLDILPIHLLIEKSNN